MKLTRFFAALALWLAATAAHADYKGLTWGLDTASSPYKVGIKLPSGSWADFGQITSGGVPTPYFPGTSCASSRWFSAVSTLGAFTCSQPAIGDISGLGSGVATALAVNSGSAGSVLINGTDTGTSGHKVPWLDGALTFSGAAQAFNGGSGVNPTVPAWFTAPITTFNSAYPGNTASADPYRASVGDFPISNEFFGPNLGATYHGVQALTGAILTPLGATSDCGSGMPCQDVGVAGYAQSLEPTRAPVGLFGEGGIGVAGGYPYGADIVVLNCKNHDPSCVPGLAYNVTQAHGIEADVVAFDTASGTPTGTFYGVHAILNRASNSGQTSSIAFAVDRAVTGSGWQTGYQCSGGASITCLTVGPAVGLTSQNSQPLTFISLDAGGLPIIHSLYQDATGALNWQNISAGLTTQFAATYPQWLFDGGSNLSVGTRTSTTATTGASATSILQTGTANSYAILQVSDGAGVTLYAGAGAPLLNLDVSGVAVEQLTASLATFNVPLKAASTPTGTPVASLCLDASGNIIKKTTTGACI